MNAPKRAVDRFDRTERFLLALLVVLAVAVSVSFVMAAEPEVSLRSGVVTPEGSGEETGEGGTRWVVRFHGPTGVFDRGLLAAAGARIETPLPGQAYLVTLSSVGADALSKISGVDWAVPYQAESKVAPEIAEVRGGVEGAADVTVLLHLFRDADPEAVAADLEASGLRVAGTGSGSRFGRIVLRMSPDEVAARRMEIAARDDVFWVSRRYRRTLLNDDVVWIDQSGLDGGQATPVHDHGVTGAGQIGAVTDTGIDADMCYFRDGTLGLPPTNIGTGGTTVDLGQRKIVAVNFLWGAEDPSNPNDWDTHGHGSHVAGTMGGDDLANPIAHDTGDGMAPGSQLVIQDAGYGADACADLPGLGCPVTDLIPVFQQTYDQGARVHNNSWGDNENAAETNVYTDAGEDVDQFIWDHPNYVLVFGAGNHALGGTGTIISPGTSKNGISVGGTYNKTSAIYLSDISAWGPTDDGRIKPDVLSPGASVYSADNDGDVTTENCGTRGMTGTSMASPGVAGSALLIRQYFEDGFYPSGAANPADAFDPTTALVKAMILNSTVPIEYDAEGRPIDIPSDEQGWGRVLLDNSMHFAGQNRRLWIDEHAGFTGPGDPDVIYQLEILDTSEPLRVTLVWSDYPSTPAASVHLLNDLDLRVDGASGGFLGNNFNMNQSWNQGGADRRNNVEQVHITHPEPGVHTIRVSAHAVPHGPQPYALVVSGGEFNLTTGPVPSYLGHLIDDSGPNGNGDGVLDPGETARIPVTLWNAGDAAATSVIGKLYSSAPGLLTVYDGEASYPDMAPGAEGSSQSPHYEVTLQPGAGCGQIVGTTLSISGAGFEVGSAFSIPVGRFESSFSSTDTPVAIPREGTVYSYINVADSFPFEEVDAEVHVLHDDISELELLLSAPNPSPEERPVYLHNQTGAGVANIDTIYDEQTQPDGPGAMGDFIGRESQGNWSLKINDVIRGTGGGDLTSWTLHFKSKVPFDCHPVTCGDPVPPAVGSSLRVSESGANDLQIDWDAVGGASEYNVWRSLDPRMQKASHAGRTSATSLTDSGAQATGETYFYEVRSVNSCNWESP